MSPVHCGAAENAGYKEEGAQKQKTNAATKTPSPSLRTVRMRVQCANDKHIDVFGKALWGVSRASALFNARP